MPTIGTAGRPAEVARANGSEPNNDVSHEMMLVDELEPTDLVDLLPAGSERREGESSREPDRRPLAQFWEGSAASSALSGASAASPVLSRTSTVSSVVSSVVA